MAHRVKTHRWNRGILESFEAWFETLELALFFISLHGHRNAKVYDDTGILVHSISNNTIDSYC